jgi:signal transduction histidine kinase
MAVFVVEDHGIGIPSTQRTRVFQPFVRLLMSEAAGSGIGLTIIKRIVEMYGGKVWIDGAEGPGCTVQFTVPSIQKPERALNAGVQVSRVPDMADAVRRGVL